MNRPLNAHIFDRAADEWYVEPVWVSTALFSVEEFEGVILDPACGQGNIVEAGVERGYLVHASDIRPRGTLSRSADKHDFFDRENLFVPNNIVTNPPFGRAILAEKFIRHALRLKPQKLAVFVAVRFLFGSKRAAGLFSEFPPARVWLITPRPSCPPGEYLRAGNKAGGGTADYCWIVWTPRESAGGTSINWLRGSP